MWPKAFRLLLFTHETFSLMVWPPHIISCVWKSGSSSLPIANSPKSMCENGRKPVQKRRPFPKKHTHTHISAKESSLTLIMVHLSSSLLILKMCIMPYTKYGWFKNRFTFKIFGFGRTHTCTGWHYLFHTFIASVGGFYLENTLFFDRLFVMSNTFIRIWEWLFLSFSYLLCMRRFHLQRAWIWEHTFTIKGIVLVKACVPSFISTAMSYGYTMRTLVHTLTNVLRDIKDKRMNASLYASMRNIIHSLWNYFPHAPIFMI